MRRVGPPALGEVVDLHGEGLAQLGVRRPGGAQLRLDRPGPGGGGGDEVVMVQGREVELLERWWRCGGEVEVEVVEWWLFIEMNWTPGNYLNS